MMGFGQMQSGYKLTIVKNIIIINVLFLFAKYVLMMKFGMDLDNIFGFHYFRSLLFKPWQLISYMFMHANLMHLAMNMFAVWMFGTVLENVWGPKKFLTFYFITGLGAIALHSIVQAIQFEPMISDAHVFFAHPSPDAFNAFIMRHVPNFSSGVSTFVAQWKLSPDDPMMTKEARDFMMNLIFYGDKMHHMPGLINVATVGASGCVFGILVAFGMLFPNVQLMLLFPPIPIKAKYMVIGYIVLELYLGIANFEWDNIAHYAHLGGGLFGFLMIKIWKEHRRDIFY